MDRLGAGRTMAVMAAALAIAVTLAGGARHPGYSHVADYISELGAVGAPNASLISFAGFLPIGLLVIGSLVAMAPHMTIRGAARVGYWLQLCNGLSYLGAAFVPCDLGCPAVGSDRHSLHNLLGLLGYGASGVGLLMLAGRGTSGPASRSVTWTFRIAGLVALAALMVLTVPDAALFRGLVQRIAEIAVFGALLLIASRVAPRPDQTQSMLQ